ncbi:MAG: phenylacetate-CoA oxygenase, PaaJ subunit [Bacteroidota bacterium]|nr:phenylacetate-CoA oxygenase, PaaJ subunit [Bacteroidota bacterium]
MFDWISGITDPEIPAISITELGILRDVKLNNGEFVITITPTYTGCPAMSRIENQIRQKLTEHGLQKITINTSSSPAWTTDWITEDVKKKMKANGIAPPPHSSCVRALKDFTRVSCPYCNSSDTNLISRFGSTPCKALYSCNNCHEPFQHFKCH